MRTSLSFSLRARAALLGLGLLLVGCAAGTGEGTIGTTKPATVGAPVPSVAPTTVPVVEPGSFAVGSLEKVLVDPSRPTAANRSAPELPDRTLPLLVVYPAAGGPAAEAAPDAPPAGEQGPFPLIVFSHGVGANGPAYRGTLEDLASAGYVVAAPTYPLSNSGTPGGAVVSDVAEQTRDVAFVIDDLTKQGAGPLSGVIDKEQLGIAGHSLGGITTLGAGYSECCAVAGVDAVAEWSGLLFGLEGEDPVDPSRDGPPLLIVHGDADNVVAYQNADNVLQTVRAPRSLVTIAGGDHIQPFLSGLDNPSSAITTRVTLAFFDQQLKGDRRGRDRLEQVVIDSAGLAALQDKTGG